jgi:NAD(P)-dependent dehydrogenase (short-subunit alcohol dehydrogenase family)
MDEHPSASVELSELDLASQTSIHAFAIRTVSEHPQIDALLNNAGIMAPPRSETSDGYELQFGTNHLGHFALTGLLLQSLLRASGCRIVTTTSFARYTGKIDFDDLNRTRSYSRYDAYGQSKLANLAFSVELQERLEQSGVDAISLAAHPGFSHTNLQHQTTRSSGSPLEGALYRFLLASAQSPQRGALPQLRAATDPHARGGEFYVPFFITWGTPVSRRVDRRSRNRDMRRRLWQESIEMTGVSYEEL